MPFPGMIFRMYLDYVFIVAGGSYVYRLLMKGKHMYR